MLIQFSVENFMSFREKAVLSMMPSSDTNKEDNVTSGEKTRCLKSAVVYGANASGKSNLFKAMAAAIILIRNSNAMQTGFMIPGMQPFRFREDALQYPSKFEFIFVVNGMKYVYGFSATQAEVIEEYLYVYYSAKASRIFERVKTNQYEFSVDKKKLRDIATKNTSNKLFLSTATAWNYDKTRDAFLWFLNGIDVYDAESIRQDFSAFENDKDGSLKRFTANLLKESNINITEFDFKAEYLTPEIIATLPSEVINIIKEDRVKHVEIQTGHQVETQDGQTNTYFLDLKDESLGTQHLFHLSPVLKYAFENGKTIIFDEFDGHLHPLLARYIIQLFHDPNVNKQNAQLIFNTHDTSLLTLELFRRDQIYFTEKNSKSGGSDLYSLDEFSVRANENVKNGYLQGRYGAIPFLGRGGGLWD